ncbi:MAG: formyltetrahydrofolate deformylase [Pseudomonadales bacterium]|nr:formyltetrahydrofolate deformylase [Pseudomonadales bacterium]
MDVKNTLSLLVSHSKSIDGATLLTEFFKQQQVRIARLEQQPAPESGELFSRLELVDDGELYRSYQLERAFSDKIGHPYRMQWQFFPLRQRQKVAIMVSQHDHVLMDLLWRFRRNQYAADISAVISNHEALRAEVERLDIPFHYIPVTPENKTSAEFETLQLLEGNADLIVLARYMQVLTTEFVSRYPQRIINIHHSFLPAFVGADPYRQAFVRGVKLIGATAHYVTEDLDQGPIIEQDAIRVSHRYSVAELKEMGQDLERSVLSRALKWHLEHRILVSEGKTTIFYN